MKIICLWSLLLVNTLFAKTSEALTTQQFTMENLQAILGKIAISKNGDVNFSPLNKAEIYELPVLKSLLYFLNETSQGTDVMKVLNILITQMSPADLAKLETLSAPPRRTPEDSTVALAAMEIRLTESIRSLSQALTKIKATKNNEESLKQFSEWLQNIPNLIKAHLIEFKRNQLKTFFQASPKEITISIKKIPVFESLNYFIKRTRDLRSEQQESVMIRILEIIDAMSSEDIEFFYSEIIKVPTYDRDLGRQHYRADSYKEIHETLINLLGKLLKPYNKSIQTLDNTGKSLLTEISQEIISMLAGKVEVYDYQIFLDDVAEEELEPVNKNSIVIEKGRDGSYEAFEKKTKLQDMFDTNISPEKFSEMSLDSLLSYSKPEALIFLLTLGYRKSIRSKSGVLSYEVSENLKNLITKFSEEEVRTALIKLESQPVIPTKTDYYDGYLTDFCLVSTHEPLDFFIDLLIKYSNSEGSLDKKFKKVSTDILQFSKGLLKIYLDNGVDIEQFERIQLQQEELKSKK